MHKKNRDFELISLEDVDSTNNYLKKLSSIKKVEEGTVIMADFQNSGRGQTKNVWHSKKGDNLLISVLFFPSINVFDHFAIVEFISLGIIDTLGFYGMQPEIKWPNDIYVGNKKIAGILIENSIMDKSIFQTIAGIGLNVNEIDFPSHLPNPTSMRLQLKKEINIKELLQHLVNSLFFHYEQIEKEYITGLHEKYNSLLYRKNLISKFRTDELTFNASILGTDKMGELQLKLEDGLIKNYLFGEVQMVIS